MYGYILSRLHTIHYQRLVMLHLGKVKENVLNALANYLRFRWRINSFITLAHNFSLSFLPSGSDDSTLRAIIAPSTDAFKNVSRP